MTQRIKPYRSFNDPSPRLIWFWTRSQQNLKVVLIPSESPLSSDLWPADDSDVYSQRSFPVKFLSNRFIIFLELKVKSRQQITGGGWTYLLFFHHVDAVFFGWYFWSDDCFYRSWGKWLTHGRNSDFNWPSGFSDGKQQLWPRSVEERLNKWSYSAELSLFSGFYCEKSNS